MKPETSNNTELERLYKQLEEILKLSKRINDIKSNIKEEIEEVESGNYRDGHEKRINTSATESIERNRKNREKELEATEVRSTPIESKKLSLHEEKIQEISDKTDQVNNSTNTLLTTHSEKIDNPKYI